MATTISSEAEELAGQIRDWRRHIHTRPELSGQEERTAQYVAAELRKIGYEPIERVGGTYGLFATLEAGQGSAVALRADMDALAVQEQTGLEFASRNPGVMHACGHDAHVAMLLGAATLLARRRSELRQPVRLIFQPAEECYPGGAAAMIEAGVLENVESIVGLHVWAEMPAGQIGTRPGPFMAAVDGLKIVIKGRGGHAAMPDHAIDPVVIAAQVILGLQTIASRSAPITGGAVVSVTRVEAGRVENVIPNEVTLAGTIRTLGAESRERVRARVHEIATGIARGHGASAEVELEPGYPSLVNDPATTARLLQAAERVGYSGDRVNSMEPVGVAEDFAYYAEKVSASFMFIGGGKPDQAEHFPHHHPRFDIDESVLPSGAALLTEYALGPQS